MKLSFSFPRRVSASAASGVGCDIDTFWLSYKIISGYPIINSNIGQNVLRILGGQL